MISFRMDKELVLKEVVICLEILLNMEVFILFIYFFLSG